MSTYETIVVRPLTANIGAEIEGLDLSKPLDNRQSEELYRAFLEHHVVFLRGQDMTPEQHMTAGRLFGEICGIPFVKSVEGYPEIVEIVTTLMPASRYPTISAMASASRRTAVAQ